MVQQLEVSPVQEVPEGSLICQHYWLIQAADGPVSVGSCRICGETREFNNYVETATWGDTRLMPSQVPVRQQVVVSSDDAWEDE